MYSGEANKLAMTCCCVAPAKSAFTQGVSSASADEGGIVLLRPRYLLKNCAINMRRYSALLRMAKAMDARTAPTWAAGVEFNCPKNPASPWPPFTVVLYERLSRSL